MCVTSVVRKKPKSTGMQVLADVVKTSLRRLMEWQEVDIRGVASGLHRQR